MCDQWPRDLFLYSTTVVVGDLVCEECHVVVLYGVCTGSGGSRRGARGMAGQNTRNPKPESEKPEPEPEKPEPEKPEPQFGF